MIQIEVWGNLNQIGKILQSQTTAPLVIRAMLKRSQMSFRQNTLHYLQ